jgi:hypothetical protein
VVYHLSQGIFLFCCFIYIFFKLAIRKNIQFGIHTILDENRKDDSGNVESPKNPGNTDVHEPFNRQEVQKGFAVKPSYVDGFYIPIRFLTIIYMVTNLLSGGNYFYSTLVPHQKQITVRQLDILAIDNLLSVRTRSPQEIIDSVNDRFPKPIFFSAGKVLAMKLDTNGAFVYYYHLKATPSHVAVSEWKVKIFNFTSCKEKLFCNCDSTNQCLRNKTIELYYLLVTRKTKKGVQPDTTYYSRIL